MARYHPTTYNTDFVPESDELWACMSWYENASEALLSDFSLFESKNAHRVKSTDPAVLFRRLLHTYLVELNRPLIEPYLNEIYKMGPPEIKRDSWTNRVVQINPPPPGACEQAKRITSLYDFKEK